MIETELDDRRNAIFSIGPDGDFFVTCDAHPHCHSCNPGLEDEVYELGGRNIAIVTLGVEDCGLILDKSGNVIEHGNLLSTCYPTLMSDIKTYVRPENSARKVVSLLQHR